MAGLCEGGSEPPGSLKANNVGLGATPCKIIMSANEVYKTRQETFACRDAQLLAVRAPLFAPTPAQVVLP
ncbi:hypothetical protein ANN_16876 [Periplaneta americana]|uniref:Uncharacterized protein n=1 Tax=Periplaneta americana TaxID=6978 RepID=A0ABQ8SSG1_PERAM|nr:hypothetical protein ANN_16876 [Periplaneta americana]